MPTPSYGEPGLKVGGKWADLLPTIPEGENYLWHTDRRSGEPLFGWRTRYWSFLLKLSKRIPAWAVQAQPGAAIGPFHWNNRRLTFHELCRLQTFPDGLKIGCGRTEMQRQLGNAVPSLIAEALAREFELAFLAMHEEALGMVPAANLAALRTSSLERDDGQGRAMAAYIDGLLAARLVPAEH